MHFLGRFDSRDPAGPRFAWPGSEVRTRFSGTGATLRIRETGGKNTNDQLEVRIDGGEPFVIKTKNDVEKYELAKGLPDAEHDVVIIKRTEHILGNIQLLGIDSAEGRPLVPTPEPYTRWIEFVGDSITCGFGVLGANKHCSFTADTEREPDAYGALTATALDAGHISVAWSGIGVYRNSDGSTQGGMRERYGLSLPGDPASTWDFSIKPDVVVVNLGTNDYTKGDPGQPYQDAMIELTTTIRGKYPEAHIIVSVSSMMEDGGGFLSPNFTKSRSEQRTALQAVVDARKAAGDARISMFEFDAQLASDGYGCGAHPNVTTQRKGAEKLAAYIRPLTGW